MTAQIIDGSSISKQIREELKQKVVELKEKHNITPGLATILVGGDPASKIYIGQKEKAANSLGIYSERYDLPETTTETELLALVARLNEAPQIHGILVQVPLPQHINENVVTFSINPKKDADGFHPANLGKLMLGEPDFIPCTPAGIQQLLIRSGVPIAGAEAVVVCRSNIVGKPIANLLLQKKDGANATVTVCHTGTRDLAAHTRRADILIVATGRPKTITADMVNENCVIIDAGINRIGKTPKGRDILVGDVDFEEVKEKVKAITPVPGGVGPMTVTMLMANTVKAAKLANGIT
ncbi:MAG: tetrahydrofolate dehydrogenase/cyclohydrolase catalytic domain-containing protein [Chloroflexota bacterium]